MFRRAAAVICVGIAALLGAAAPAVASAFATYVTTVTGVSPALSGLTAKATPNGESITVRNTSATPVVVEGYQGEPYLKITAHGVWQNSRSPAVYLNKEQTIGNIPSSADARRAPVWKKIDDGHTASWHDHRIHWMGVAEAPAVQKDPDHRHLIANWKIPMVAGTAKGRISGTLVYEPSKSHVGTWLTGGVLVLAVLVAGALVVVSRRRAAERVTQSG